MCQSISPSKIFRRITSPDGISRRGNSFSISSGSIEAREEHSNSLTVFPSFKYFASSTRLESPIPCSEHRSESFASTLGFRYGAMLTISAMFSANTRQISAEFSGVKHACCLLLNEWHQYTVSNPLCRAIDGCFLDMDRIITVVHTAGDPVQTRSCQQKSTVHFS